MSFADEARKAGNFAKAVVAQGGQLVKGEPLIVAKKVSDARLDICKDDCENFIDHGNEKYGCKHPSCGCRLQVKTTWSSQKCPLGKWPVDHPDGGGTVAVIIPSRNEPYLMKTVEDLFENALGDIEIWVVLDAWDKDPENQIPKIKALAETDSRVHVLENETPKGLRYGMNKPASLTTAKYVMKCDAHMSFSFGYDVALKEHCDEKTLCIPRLRSLDPETWTPGKRFLDHQRFTKDFRMAYWTEYSKRVEDEVAPETLLNIGATWFCETDWWWHIGGQDESLGLWGQTGIEISLKTWFNGGRQVLVKAATGNHYFRKKFPYRLNGHHVAKTKEVTKNQWKDHPKLEWLLEKFKPVPEWHEL